MQVGEDITVLASFGKPYRIKPLSFTWSGRTVTVKEVTYAWKTREGQKDLHHFSVTDGSTLFELSFDVVSLLWRVESIET
ncbi:MAG: hypothetical protein HZB62_03720 [Nitrospirae bacterium]|nr:hypothetical protein [Nitrospirota bacterium]